MALAVRSFGPRGTVAEVDRLSHVGPGRVRRGQRRRQDNLYRALELLHRGGQHLAADLVREGGLQSALWAGQRRRGEQPELRLRWAWPIHASSGGSAYRYEVTVGFPPPAAGAFAMEPHIKEEAVIWSGGRRPVRLVERKGPSVMARDGEGRPAAMDIDLLPSETILGRLEDPSRYPELDAIRRTLLQWRFYHSLRTDAASPLRRPCAAVAAPTWRPTAPTSRGVRHPGRDPWDTVDLRQAVDMAFPGARVQAFAPTVGLVRHDLSGVSQSAVRSRGAVGRHLALSGPGRGAAGLSPAAVRRPQ